MNISAVFDTIGSIVYACCIGHQLLMKLSTKTFRKPRLKVKCVISLFKMLPKYSVFLQSGSYVGVIQLLCFLSSIVFTLGKINLQLTCGFIFTLKL